MSQAPAPAKICTVCGEDCSKRPRSKDPQGRYTCDDCVKRIRSAEAPSAAAAVSPAPSPLPIVEDDAPLAIMEEPETPAYKPSIPCPNCQAPLGSGVMICVNCGFNRTTGEKIGTSTDGKDRSKKKAAAGPKAFACAQCGYNLTGLKTTRCPECGKVNTLRSSKRERELEESKRQAKLAYIRPLIMIAAGLGITCAIVASQAGSVAIAGYLMLFGVGFVISLAVYFVCSLMFIGFDEPFYLTAIRLAGVCAVTDVVWIITAPLPIGWGKWLLVGAVWVGLMVTVMEIDQEDAIIVGAVTMLVKVAGMIWLVSMFM